MRWTLFILLPQHSLNFRARHENILLFGHADWTHSDREIISICRCEPLH